MKALTVTVPAVVSSRHGDSRLAAGIGEGGSAEKGCAAVNQEAHWYIRQRLAIVPMTCTTSGAPKLCPDWVVCRSPETFVMDATRTTVDGEGGRDATVGPRGAALTVIGPAAAGEKVTMVCAWPTALVAETAELTVAWPAGETIHCTFVLAIVTKPEASVTLTTRGAEV